MIKKILCFGLCFVMILGLVACSNNGDTPPAQDTGKDVLIDNSNNEQDTEVNTEVNENTEATENKKEDNHNNINKENTYRENTPEYVAQKFFENLLTNDYETALTCFNGSAETPFFTGADIEWYLPRSDYADILSLNYENYVVSAYTQDSASGRAECIVHVEDENSESGWTFKLHLKLNNKNEWIIDDEDFYIKDYYLVVPGGSVVTIDGVEVSNNYEHDKYGSTRLRQLYKIDCIGKSEKLFAVNAESTFGTIEENLYPVTNDIEEPYVINVYYIETEGYKALGDLWIAFYNGFKEGKTYSDMLHLLSPTADPKTAEVIMSSIEQLTENGDCYDFIISNVNEMADPEWKSEYLTTNIITMAFNYTINWTENHAWGPEPQTMNNYDNLLIYYDGTNWTVHENSYNQFFGYLNSLTNRSK